MNASFHIWTTVTEPCLILNVINQLQLSVRSFEMNKPERHEETETTNHMRGRARTGMNEKQREREGGEERKWWLSDGAGKACLHLNTATTCNQMGGLMRKESCLNTTPRCRAAPTGSTGRPNRECVRVCACWWSTVCNVSDEGLKVDAKSCVTGKHHLGAQRSVDTQSQQEHCYRVFRSNCWKREDFPHIPPSPFLGV